MPLGMYRVTNMSLRSKLRPLAVRSLDLLFDIYATKSYSQEGEDLILRRIFANKRDGFYVDVGAHHPRRFSNTQLFYRRGWQGINIEPNPDAIGAFHRSRRRDTNLQLGVSDRAETLRYYCFDEPALNTFDHAIVQQRTQNTPYRLVRTIDVPVQRLDEILARHLPASRRIDFLSIDVEGRDLAVLQSNDWRQFRPSIVLAEALGNSLDAIADSDIFQLMKAEGYELIAKTFNTLMFRDRAAT